VFQPSAPISYKRASHRFPEPLLLDAEVEDLLDLLGPGTGAGAGAGADAAAPESMCIPIAVFKSPSHASRKCCAVLSSEP